MEGVYVSRVLSRGWPFTSTSVHGWGPSATLQLHSMEPLIAHHKSPLCTGGDLQRPSRLHRFGSLSGAYAFHGNGKVPGRGKHLAMICCFGPPPMCCVDAFFNAPDRGTFTVQHAPLMKHFMSPTYAPNEVISYKCLLLEAQSQGTYAGTIRSWHTLLK